MIKKILVVAAHPVRTYASLDLDLMGSNALDTQFSQIKPDLAIHRAY